MSPYWWSLHLSSFVILTISNCHLLEHGQLSCSAFLKKTDCFLQWKSFANNFSSTGGTLFPMLWFCLVWDCIGLSLLSSCIWKTLFPCSYPLSLSLSVVRGKLWALRRGVVIDIDVPFMASIWHVDLRSLC